MIVADASLVARLVIEGPDTALAQAVYDQDDVWTAPSLLRYEMRHVLLKHIRAKLVDLAHAEQVLETAFAVVSSIDDSASDFALAIAVELQISSYDAEYIVLAQRMSMPVVTFDQKLLRAARGIAISADEFIA
jgi:predicted nucleic acid-binding protein